ncbi:MAG: zinc-binding dehydrogenase [Saprospiraceae bacterium]
MVVEGWILRNNTLVYATDVNIGTMAKNIVECIIKASALNHRDIWITKGLYPKILENVVLGSDACVELNGKRYLINPSQNWGSQQSVQDDQFTVLGMPTHGTFSKSILISESQLEPCPSHLTDFEAAALPLAGLTAYRALIARAKACAGEKVLINGIGGGVALFAFQMALALGCEVFVTSGSQAKLDKAISMGAKAGYLYHEKDWSKHLIHDFGGVDVVIDSAGGEGFNELVKIARPGARIAMYGATHGRITNLNSQVLFWRQLSILGSTMGSDVDFKNMVNFVNEHKIHPVVDTILPILSLPQGMEIMEKGHQFGKIVFSHTL